MLEALSLTTLLGLASVAAWFDASTNRIPNRVTVAGLSLGIALSAAGGAAIAMRSISAAAVALLLGFALFVLGVWGAGDAKLLMAMAALVGLERLGAMLALTAVAGALLSLAVALRRGVLLPVLLNSRDVLLCWATLGLRRNARVLPSPVGSHVPYGVAIGIGGLGAWFL